MNREFAEGREGSAPSPAVFGSVQDGRAVCGGAMRPDRIGKPHEEQLQGVHRARDADCKEVPASPIAIESRREPNHSGGPQQKRREDQRQQELPSFRETESEQSVTGGGSGALGALQDPDRSDPEGMAVRCLQLELEKVRLQLECERVALRRAEIEQSSRSPSMSGTNDRRHTGIDGVAQCAKMLKAYRLPCDADVPMWFDEVEKLFSSFQVPEENRVHLIMPALSERVRYMLCSLSEEECVDYEIVKRAVLNELKLTPAEYLDRFQKVTKKREETWAQFASRARTYFAYYLQSRNADTKEAVAELMVADRMKASLGPEGLEYVLLREGEKWFKPVEVAKVLETFEQAKGKGRATKTVGVPTAPPLARQTGIEKANVRCYICRGQGHVARDCPQASSKEQQAKLTTVPKQRVHNVAIVGKLPPPEQERVLSARVEVFERSAGSGRSKLELIPITCGGITTEAVLDTGSEITVIREGILPQRVKDSSGAVRLQSAFGKTIQATLATLPIALNYPGGVGQPQKVDLVCAITDQLADGVNCLLSKEDWELLHAQEDNGSERESVTHVVSAVGLRSSEMKDSDTAVLNCGRGETVDEVQESGESGPAFADQVTNQREQFRAEQLSDDSLRRSWEDARKKKAGMFVADGLLYHQDALAGVKQQMRSPAEPEQRTKATI
ncbi:LOW QUALITY PROTEIN: uncharacterized protein LOC125757868 [Rhipicephalus sanguineus]|uniref:LOW QUALITY PROTEIN: uncharacterized protein LOC125757868 n=1 Tax=Rhipicephalus sanguineus TaxID=34632 RepID=UPI0020C5A5BF|nr:LOW QUALITY PROTEIN: uncharacterized protein LOC125757868 [Rhipicephalus sanguineus]